MENDKCESLSLSFSPRLLMRDERIGVDDYGIEEEEEVVAGREIEREGERVNQGSTVGGS